MKWVQNKRGFGLVLDQLIYIVITLSVLALLFTFVFITGASASSYERKYAKQIALTMDVAEPGMIIRMRMDDALNEAIKVREIELDDIGKFANEIVWIDGNVVWVNIDLQEAHGYSFFNNVKVTRTYDNTKREFIFVVEKNEK